MNVPRDSAIDSTLSLWRDGYPFLWNRFQRFGSDIFTLRVMGRRAVAIHGREAARIFYDQTKVERAGALPRRVVTSLFGKKAIHTLDGEAHRHRKAAFLSLMTPEGMEALTEHATAEWREAAKRWPHEGTVSVFDEAALVLTKATCAWIGIPLEDTEARLGAKALVAMVDSFGGAGPRLWRGKASRMIAERWVKRIVEETRAGKREPAPGSALERMADFRDLDGSLLPAKVAAVEILNVLRPTVAIAWYIAFAAHALHKWPATRQHLAQEPVGEDPGSYADLFMQEVRRFYPFTPYLGAKVKAPFEWNGHAFEEGEMVLLDVYGSHHDPELWPEPEAFRPERFLGLEPGPYDFFPQGGGPRFGHRCPGEWIVMHNVTLALHLLTRCIHYDVAAAQDLSIDLSRMPTRPKSGVLIENVELLPALNDPFPRQPSVKATHGLQTANAKGEVGRGAHAVEGREQLSA